MSRIGWVVIGLSDPRRYGDRETEDPIIGLLTRQVFATKGDAARYAATIPHLNPLCIPGAWFELDRVSSEFLSALPTS